MKRLLAALVVAVALAAPVVALVEATRASRTEAVVPWQPIPVAQRPTRALAPPCRARDLGRPLLFLQGATGSLVGGVTLTKTADAPCSLLERPTTRFLGRSARANHWRTYRLRLFDPGPIGPRSPLRALHRGERVSLGLFWSNWCDPGSPPGSGPGVPPTALALEPAHGGGSVRVPVDAAPRCDAPAGPSSLGVGRFGFAPRPPAPSSRLPFRVSLSDVPAHARRGGRLRFVVTLTAQRAFRFRDCPAYREQISRRAEFYVLACEGARAFERGERTRFEMFLRVSRGTRLGPRLLYWQLGPQTWEPPSADRVVVVRPY